MFQGFFSQLASDAFMAHGMCLLWRPELLWLHAGSDAMITLAYFSIPFALVHIVRQRSDLVFPHIFLWFGAFILLCGLTHAFGIWVLWNPDYAVEGAVKLATGIVSISTAVLVWRIMPDILALPNLQQFRETNIALERQIDQRRRAEENLRELNATLERRVAERTAELEQANEQLRAVVDTAVDGIILIDERGTVRLFNPACERLFGYDRDEVVGRNVKMLMPESYAAEHDSYLENYHNTGERKIIGIGRDVTAQKKDGAIFPIRLSVGEADPEHSSVYVGVIHDLSERKRLEERLAGLVDQLSRTNRDLEEFAYVASHDLQEPARKMITFSNRLIESERERLSEHGRDYLDRIHSASTRMQTLIEELLNYARLGYSDIRKEPVDAAAEARRAGEDLELAIEESGATVAIGDIPAVSGDATLVHQLFYNLIANALKFSHPERRPSIAIRGARHGDRVTIEVEDNGIGIEAKHRERAFKMFHRLQGRSEKPGSGAGLAICKKIVERHGGTIEALGEPDRGTIIRFDLPADARSPHGLKHGAG